MSKTDILIIGGGIAGCIAAISLVKHYNVTLIDKQVTPTDRIGESLAPAAQRILKKLDILENEPDYVKRELFSNNMGMQSYWGSDQLRIVDHLRNPDGAPLSLNRKKFEIYLRKIALERGVQCLWGIKFFNSIYENNYWKIRVKNNDLKNQIVDTIYANFVIDASGRQSHFTKSLGIKRVQYDKLISCWLSLPNTETNTMNTIVADELGWWYSAVLPNNIRILSFQTDADLIDKSTFKKSTSFLALIKKNKRMYSLVENKEKSITFHGVVSANSTYLNKAVGKQWVALGDAAISFDPLSSQGMFNAMANAMQLTELLTSFNFINDLDTTKIKQFNNEYSNQIAQVWKHYLQHKNIFYSAETRWKSAPFWKRRQQKI